MAGADRLVAAPTMSLPEALEKTRRLYAEAHRRRLSREEVAKYLGYGGLNGASMTMLATLTKYGLLEGRGEQIRVSDDAVLLLVEERGAADRAAAMRRTAMRPELFKTLSEQFEGGPLPTDNSIRIRLEKLGFTPKAASSAARTYRETMELLEEEGATHIESVDEEFGKEDSTVSQQQFSPQQASLTAGQSSAFPSGQGKLSPLTQQNAEPGGILYLQVPFKGMTLSVRIETSGQALTKAHLAKVGQYLKLAEDDLQLPLEE